MDGDKRHHIEDFMISCSYLSNMNKRLLKQLIKEVIKEAEQAAPADSTMANTMAAKNAEQDTTLRDTIIKLRIRGMKSGAPTWKEFLGNVAYDAKMKDLEIIHAELEKSGKRVATMNAGELNAKSKDAEEDHFNTSKTKAVTSMKSKVKPPINPNVGGSEEWEKAADRDMQAGKPKLAIKRNQMKAGTYDPEETDLWSDAEWKDWEANDREKDPKSWAAFDQWMKIHQRT